MEDPVNAGPTTLIAGDFPRPKSKPAFTATRLTSTGQCEIANAIIAIRVP
jgi:hypothetical protein